MLTINRELDEPKDTYKKLQDYYTNVVGNDKNLNFKNALFIQDCFMFTKVLDKIYGLEEDINYKFFYQIAIDKSQKNIENTDLKNMYQNIKTEIKDFLVKEKLL